MPAVGAAVDRHRGARRIVGVIDVAAAVSGEGDLLSPRGQPPQIPFGADERALRVLTLDADDRQAVGLQIELAAEQVAAKPRVDRRKRDRDLLLNVIDAQTFECPASNTDVAVRCDPVGFDQVP